jgi:hypothetical protein
MSEQGELFEGEQRYPANLHTHRQGKRKGKLQGFGKMVDAVLHAHMPTKRDKGIDNDAK